MGKDFSPEERLLRLIRSKAPKQAPAAYGDDKPKEEFAKTHSVSSKVSTALTHKEPPRQTASLGIKSVFRWENLNLALMVLLIGLLLYFVPFFLRNLKSPVKNLEEKIIEEATKGPAPKAALPSADKRPPFDYFSEPVGARNIFSPVLKEETQTKTPQEEGPKLEDIKGQLSLLGVVGGDSPQAIIEDKRTQKTYFLNKGSIFDDIEVGDILENKVILNYKGKQFELVI